MWVKGLSDRYGMTAQEYDLLLESQNGQCAMCGTDNPGPVRTGGVDRKFSVDHDHETGKVRAILCSKCNTGLGMLGDNPAEAAAMLLSYSKLVNPIDADYF